MKHIDYDVYPDYPLFSEGFYKVEYRAWKMKAILVFVFGMLLEFFLIQNRDRFTYFLSFVFLLILIYLFYDWRQVKSKGYRYHGRMKITPEGLFSVAPNEAIFEMPWENCGVLDFHMLDRGKMKYPILCFWIDETYKENRIFQLASGGPGGRTVNSFVTMRLENDDVFWRLLSYHDERFMYIEYRPEILSELQRYMPEDKFEQLITCIPKKVLIDGVSDS